MKAAYNIFNNLSGTWLITRILQSKKPGLPSGKVTGFAKFNPLDKNTLHYVEQGKFETEQNESFEVKRENIYSYEEGSDSISKYNSENGKKGSLLFKLTTNESKAEGVHLCGNDRYEVFFHFVGAENFKEFSLTYEVTGPEKDYTSKTIFERSPSLE